MKKIMKKALSLVLVLALTIVPMTAYAATLGEYDNPYLVKVDADAIDVTIDVENGVYVKADNSNGSILTVESASHADYSINYCRMNYSPEDGATTMTLPMVADMDFVYISNVGDAALSMKLSLEGGEAVDTTGTVNDPEEVVFEENATTVELTKELEAGNEGYYYTYTAEENGTITVKISAYDANQNEIGWRYNVNNITTGIYSETYASDAEVPMSEVSIDVKAGEEVTVMAATYDPANEWTAPAGIVNCVFTFEAVETDDIVTDGDATPDTDDVVTDGDATPETPDGEKADYVISDTVLTIGTNEVAIVPNATNSLYAINVADNGDDKDQTYKYTFTVSEGKIGAWGTTFFPNDSTAEKTQTLETEVTEGATILVGVCDATSANITITVTAEEVVKQEVKEIIYTNTVTPQKFTFTGEEDLLLYPDLEDGVEDKAVLGTDGYYHLNTADGPVLFADLDDIQLSIADAADYGQLRDYFFDEAGTPIERVDYSQAVLAYYECADEATGLYPLTADLIEVYQKVGAEKEWYAEDSFLGYTEADAWMFACYYDEAILTLDGAATPNAPSTDVTVPETGDNANIALWAVVLGLGMTAIASTVVMKKREF